MIAAMDLGVASLATTADQSFVRRRAAGQIWNSGQHVLMGAARVTLLAQERARGNEQHFLVGTMRLVAVETVLANRRMLPDERAALFGVAGIADVIHRVRIEHRSGRRAMRVVAAFAGHLALRQGHMRAFAELGALLLMAGVAGLGNARFLQQTGGGEPRHGVVAVAACDLVRGVRRTGPVNALPPLVAA